MSEKSSGSKWRHPFPKSSITARYGATANRPNAHRGLDYAVKANSWIPAATAGTIRLNTWSDVLGWVLVHSAWDYKEKRTVFVGYSHLKRKSPHKEGGKIAMGQGVGIQGNTGSASRGDHLHLTIGPTVRHVFLGVTFDPETFIDQMIQENTNAL
jgi:murein DD-endopeptidase MepM/ murein hydrolase activator NlpD